MAKIDTDELSRLSLSTQQMRYITGLTGQRLGQLAKGSAEYTPSGQLFGFYTSKK